MFEEFIREINKRERSELEKLVSQQRPQVTLLYTTKWVSVWVAGLALLIGLASIVVRLTANPAIGIIGGVLGVAALICLYAVILLVQSYFHWGRLHRKFQREDVPEIMKALADGRVAVKKVKATAVIEIEEFEDEGAGYIFDIGSGKILFLKGQWFSPLETNIEWPNSEFEIVRTVHANRWVGILCYGQRLEPVRVIESSECKDEIVWEEREDVLEGTIESFAQSITKAA